MRNGFCQRSLIVLDRLNLIVLDRLNLIVLDRLNLKRTMTSSESALEGKLFVEFIALEGPSK